MSAPTRRATLAAKVLLASSPQKRLPPAERARLLAGLGEACKIITSAAPAEAEAWIRMGERVAAGTPFAEAEADFKAELARLRAPSSPEVP